MNKNFVLAIDQGTTGTRAILYNEKAKSAGSAYREFKQYYPKPGWVEHDALEIWKTTEWVIQAAIRKAKISSKQIKAIGITNQRETIVLWDSKTGKPVTRSIVWQDRRTSDLCEKLKKKRCEKIVRNLTGLVLDPYFSATKLTWLFSRFASLKKRAQAGEVLFGTIDSWLLWKLTGGTQHATDMSNASRTLLFNIKTKKWDPKLLKIFKVPQKILPKVKESGALFGKTVKVAGLAAGTPIHAIMGDQQAALYGQGCYKSGQVKNTYGTGCFVVMNAGKKIPKTPAGLLVTLACNERGEPLYAVEGSIFIAGAAMQWLRDGLGFFKKASESERVIRGLKDSGGVTMIPAFVGLGSPHWNPHARGMISGITRGTTRAHIIRATLESIAHQSADVLERMVLKTGCSIRELKVDGGATSNKFLMQTQADLLGRPILVSDIQESTAWGVAKLAALNSGFWKNLSVIDRCRKYKKFLPKMKKKEVLRAREHWQEEIERILLK